MANRKASLKAPQAKGLSTRRERNYSDAEKAAALVMVDFYKGNALKASKVLEIPHSTLCEWIRGRVPLGLGEIRNEKKRDLCQRLEDLAHSMIDKMVENPQVAALELAIIVDKYLLLKGQPTSITQNNVTGISHDQRRGLLADYLGFSQPREVGSISPSANGAGH